MNKFDKETVQNFLDKIIEDNDGETISQRELRNAVRLIEGQLENY